LSHYESDEPEELLFVVELLFAVELLASEALLELDSLPEDPLEAELFRP
jgi:hypothetical protein